MDIYLLKCELVAAKENLRHMENANKYYTEHGTMVGFELMGNYQAKVMDRRASTRYEKLPYASWEVAGVKAKIERIEAILSEASR